MKTTRFLTLALVTVLILWGTTLQSQILYDFGFQRDMAVPVYNTPGQPLKNAWVGGLNSAHFNQIDLNMDGIKDLVVFDTHRDKLTTYLNSGTSGMVDYVYAPQYELLFPKIYSWIRLKDFDNDGKEDIFTYGFAGIKIYKNTSTVAGGLSFSLYIPNLNSDQGGLAPSNILLTYVDYPAIDDIDGDGDLDVLAFYGLGTLIEFHRNLSVENTGNADTLWMELQHRCWGWMAENSEDNSITLHIDVVDTTIHNWCVNSFKGSTVQPPQTGSKHTGSTMLLLDLNGDSLKDLILGDTDFPNLVALYNGGTLDTARMTSLEYNFPASDTPAHVFSLSTADYLDLDNDGKKDLLVGAMSPGWENPKSDNIASTWFYKNTGTTASPILHLQTKSFLQGEMIDAGSNSHPVLFDYDGDSLLDLFIGNYGILDSTWMDPLSNLFGFHKSNITLYKNTGTATQPAFTLVTNDFAGMHSLGLVGAYLTFGDLNGDGKPDMIMGDTTGKLHYFQNTAPTGYPLQLTYITGNYQGIDVGMFSIPQLIDLDGDSLLDLAIGYKGKPWTPDSVYYFWKTSISYYRNTGTVTAPVFTLQTDSLGGVNVNDNYFHYSDGYSAPYFYRDSSGTLYLFTGSGTGMIFYYRGINNNLNGVFEKDSNMVHITDYDHFYSVQHFENQFHSAQTIDASLKSSVAIGDLNSDGYPDMIVGNYAGGLYYFKGSQPLGVGIPKTTRVFEGDVTLYPNPAGHQANILIKGADQSILTTTTVFSITGQKMLEVQHKGDDFFPVNTYLLPNGIYLVRIEVSSPGQGTSGVFTRKLVVKR